MPPLLHGQAEAGRLRWPHRPLRAALRTAQGTLSLNPERRAALVAARLEAIARSEFGLDVPTGSVSEWGTSGAALRVGTRMFIDPGDTTTLGIGAALAWTLRHDGDNVDLVIESTDETRLGMLARHAQLFDPAPAVWQIDGITVHAVEAAHLGPPLVPPPSTAEQVLLLEQAGVEVVVEGGNVLGEVRGLEVARVVVADDGSASLQVGVGRFDREAFALIHAELAPPAALARVVADVGALRAPGAEPHPVNRLARERWLRHQLVAAPELVDAVELGFIESTLAREGIRDGGIAAALGRRADGSQVVVACSVGIDLEAVPVAADTRAWHAADADLVIVVPPGDAHPVTRLLAERLAQPAQVTEIAGEWPR